MNGAVETTAVVPVVKKKEKKGKRKDKKVKSTKVEVPWSISEAVGGWFLPHDSVFSPDEKFLVLATRSYLHIYSTQTSLLVRSLRVIRSEITSYAISESKPTQVYAATATGLITTWDLDTGKWLGRWDIKSEIRGIAAVLPAKGSQDIIFTQEAGNRHVINAQTLRTGAQASENELKQILRTDEPIRSFQVLSAGAIIVVALQNSMMIGKALPLSTTDLKELEYVWRTFKIQQAVTSFHARLNIQTGPIADPQKALSGMNLESLDLAIGCVDGAILLYDDIVRKLKKIEKKSEKKNEKPENIVPRRLHWHREGVASLKWSVDGNYLISGGKETVLVIWQLSTGKKEHLPHLTSEIESVVVSPSGTSYGVRLADNSLIVLSTTELKPKTSIAGIQSRRVLHQAQEQSQTGSLPFTLQNSSNPVAAYEKVPMAVNPLNPNQILLPIPSSQPRSEMNDQRLPAPYLQTFDISTARHVSRQALTRNNATNFNLGPNRLKLREPDVKLMQLSHDGKWLATVEDWAPPPSDIEHIGENDTDAAQEQSSRREIYLKFWLWNHRTGVWALEARIDTPHRFLDDMATCQIFDLVSHPTEVGFATIGEDSFVRVWKPKIRRRDGAVVRSATFDALYTWSNSYSVELESSVQPPETKKRQLSPSLPLAACLAYSADGSALAATQDWGFNTAPGLVHLINTKTGLLHRSLPNLYIQKLAALAFVGQHLVVVSESVTVWDLVDDELSYSHSIELSQSHQNSLIHLAVNAQDGTFAVAFPTLEFDELPLKKSDISAPKIRKASSTIIIFDPSKPKPLHNLSLPDVVMALLPTLNGSGYITLDSAAELRIINPKASASIPLIGPIARPDQSLATAGDMEEEVEEMEVDDEEREIIVPSAGKDNEVTDDEIEDTENDKPVVRPEHLAQIFDVGPSFAGQSMKELFNSVVGLYARKLRARWEQDVTVGI
ncbi:WD40 repeat-like protein [Lophium mytilinum]|uniref:WD40 repeat-like protein n=1 Tax=Lophium mytilinum TaxID=390894 RepID=A0A6A6RDL1_9PEZI|nr:WD40 repeat-like protein [Lophium mytilinum]